MEQYKISALSTEQTEGQEPLVVSPVEISQVCTEHVKFGWSKLSCSASVWSKLSCSASVKYTPDFEDLLQKKHKTIYHFISITC